MFDVIFYADKHGWEPVGSYINELISRTDKSSRVKLQKIYDYVEFLKEHGKGAGEPYIKHIEGELWELRPAKDRILFAAWDGQRFILLHHFVKKTPKTPRREIDTAKRYLSDFKKRSAQ
ncbi:MAG: type II toxin-antitoxin system RelE/ParE family toxin [Chitinispirillales bacterium]|jgi:phage-related protein|nr:type II toxin-antitoxin system RelE/ParE family toxin [Chitinispirillales bacterium]